MLTKNERHWAINAKMRMSHKNDFRCGKCGVRCFVPYAPCMCVMTKMDVAWEIEFLSRVAVKLAITGDAWNFEDMPCRGERQYMRSKCPLRKNHWDCADCYIKAARLQVEEEMDEAN